MSRNKDKETKDFTISERKKVGSGLTNAPVWLMQKAGDRLWNNRQKRTWKNIEMTQRQRLNKRGQVKKTIKSGDHKSKKRKGDQ
jgi:hypothetical protein